MRTIRIDDRTYALGLWWLIPPDGQVSPRDMLKLAREMADQEHLASENYNQVALRVDQYGLGRHDDPLPPKTLSLAAALRPQIKQEAYLGIFCLGESLWWVCCQLHGLISADGDVICRTREEAFKAAAQQKNIAIGDVGHEEVLHESSEASLAYLRPLLWPDAALRPLHGASHDERLLRRGLIGAVSILVFCIVSSCIYDAYQARQQAGLNTRRVALKEAQKREYQAHPERYFKKVWEDAPDFIAAGAQCAKEILALPISENVWMLDEAVCSPGASLKVSWAHRRGAPFVALPSGARLITPQQAVENRPLSRLSARPRSAGALMTREEATAAMYEITQNISGHLSLIWDPPEQFKIDEETSISAPWQRGSFDISQLPAASFLGSDLFGALSYPGAALLTLTWSSNDLTIKGYIYANVLH